MLKTILVVAGLALLVLALPTQSSATTCPAAGVATDCGVIITVTAQSGGVATAFTVGPGPAGNGNPYDGAEDTLVGITNNSGASINSINLTSSLANNALGFEGDGACQLVVGCVSDGTSGYNGTGNAFGPVTVVGGNQLATLTFLSGLAAGGHEWFSLEGTPASITGSVPEPSSLFLLGSGLLSLVGFTRRRLAV